MGGVLHVLSFTPLAPCFALSMGVAPLHAIVCIPRRHRKKQTPDGHVIKHGTLRDFYMRSLRGDKLSKSYMPTLRDLGKVDRGRLHAMLYHLAPKRSGT